MAEILHGDAGGNQLNATANRTQVYGLQGNDTLTSDGKSNVLLVGGSGDDRLIMSGGNGTLAGGAGNDTFELNYSADKKISAVIEDFVPSEDKIVVNFDGNAASQLTSSTTSDGNVIWRDGNGNFNVTVKGVRDNDYFDGTARDEIWKVLELTNAEREKENLAALTVSDGLTAGASVRAEEITEQGVLGLLTDHSRPDGTDFSTVLDGKYNNPKENLDGGAESPEQVVNDWMNSTSHRKNILDSNFHKLGVGYNYDDPDPTNLRYYWIQLFANSLNDPETIDAKSLLNATPQINNVKKFIPLTENPETYQNSEYGVTIAALGGNDSIGNSGLIVSISGGADNDTVDNRASFATINAGTGDDSIRLGADTKENLIQYAAGDGNDTVNGFHATDTLSITDGEYTPATVGNNIVVAVGDGSINLTGAANLTSVNIDGTRSKVYILTDDDNTLENTLEGAIIAALGGKDTIENEGASVSINGGDGNDSIRNIYSDNTTISGGDGSDTIYNWGSNVSISGNAGDDYIDSTGDSVTLNGGSGNDYVWNGGDYSTISGGDGDDSIRSSGENVSISGNAGDDYIDSFGDSVMLDGGDGNDFIENIGDYSTISGGDGSDTIENYGSNVSISGGTGDDSVWNRGDNVTIDGGANNDYIILDSSYGNPKNNLFKYTAGDGSDTIENFNENSILSIEGAEYFAHKDNNDIVVEVDTGSIRLLDAAILEAVKINDETLKFAGEEGKEIILSDDPETLENTLEGATIHALGGNDSIANDASNVLINAGMDDDSIRNRGNNSTVNGGDGNDFIYNDRSDHVTIDGGTGNDAIYNWESHSLTIKGGAGDDTITNRDSENILFTYNAGDGNDTVNGFNSTATLQIGDGTGTYSTQVSGSDVIVSVGSGSILLTGAARLSAINIAGVDNTDTTPPDTTPTGLYIYKDVNNTLITGTELADTIENLGSEVTIDAGAGDDSISNWGEHVTINGGDGNDFIYNDRGQFVTIDAGAGDDSISNRGDDSTVNGDDYVAIDGGEGNDTISASGNRITINGGDGNDYIEVDGENIIINGGLGSDTVINSGDNVAIDGGEGNDSIDNSGDNVAIDAGAGDDTITNRDGKAVLFTYNAGDGNDTVNGFNSTATLQIGDGTGTYSTQVSGSDVIVSVGTGSILLTGAANLEALNITGTDNTPTDTTTTGHYIYNYLNNTLIPGTKLADTIENLGSEVTIDAGAGDDSIRNNWLAYSVSISGGSGNDDIWNGGDNVTIDGGDGDDTIRNSGSNNITINGGDGNDYITGSRNVYGGAGNDTILGCHTVNGGTGDDFIENGLISEISETGEYDYFRYKDFLYHYSIGDGNDTIVGFDKTSTLNISAESSLVSSVGSGDDVIIKVGDGSIRLKDYREKEIHIILSSGGTSGGGSGSGGGGGGSGSGGGSSSGAGGSGSGGSSGGSGGSGSGGSSGSSGSGGTSGTSSGKGSSSGGSRIRTAIYSSRGSSSAESQNVSATVNQVAPDYISQQQIPSNTKYSSAVTSTGEVVLPNLDFSSATTQQIVSQRVYNGGNQIISDYQSGQKIVFAEVYTGAFFDAANNFCVGSSTGALVIQNATDKVVDLTDAAGNDFLKAYAASTAGVIDGRGLAGFEIINGSAGADAIYAGDGGSQLWGGADVAADALVGGGGTDIFIGGRTQGADVFSNASSADIVHLNDASLNDIVATAENNGAIAIAFNTGNVVGVQSSEALSATFMLADGSKYRFNHSTKNWQTA